MSVFCRFVLIVFLPILFQYSNAYSQGVQDTSIFEKNGRKFYIHVVVAGNTLYSISRQYNVSIQEIEEFNPESKAGLSIGDSLYILAIGKDKQLIEKNMEVDGNYIIHEVQKRQTLYAISKIYGINISDIMVENPELKDGVKEGQFIKIPVTKLKEEKEETYVDESEFIQHKIVPKETLYSLSRLYGVTSDNIIRANNGLTGGLKDGEIVLIPKIPAGTTIADSSRKKEAYNVAFILPFYLDMNDTLMAHLKVGEDESVFGKSIVALQFYEGCRIALDSLKKIGLKFNVRFFDTAKDSNEVDKLIVDGSLNDMDLIIGPFYLTEFQKIAAFAMQKGIHIVCPVSQNNKILLGNEKVSKVATSRNVMFKNLGKYAAILFRQQNIIMIGQQFRANPLSLAFKNEFLSTLMRQSDTANSKNLKEVKWDSGPINVIKAKLKDSVVNLIVVPSNDQAYVTELLMNLNQLRDKYFIRVIGLDNWMRYTNVDFEYFENLGVMLPADGFIDYDKPEVKRFIISYTSRFRVFPEKYAFQGFDITSFYLKLLHKEEGNIEPALIESNERMLYFKFHYFKTGVESGYENSSTVLLEYRNFKLSEVPLAEY